MQKKKKKRIGRLTSKKKKKKSCEKIYHMVLKNAYSLPSVPFGQWRFLLVLQLLQLPLTGRTLSLYHSGRRKTEEPHDSESRKAPLSARPPAQLSSRRGVHLSRCAVSDFNSTICGARTSSPLSVSEVWTALFGVSDTLTYDLEHKAFRTQMLSLAKPRNALSISSRWRPSCSTSSATAILTTHCPHWPHAVQRISLRSGKNWPVHAQTRRRYRAFAIPPLQRKGYEGNQTTTLNSTAPPKGRKMKAAAVASASEQHTGVRDTPRCPVIFASTLKVKTARTH